MTRKKINRDELILFLNEYLNVASIEDYALNGLQIEGCGEISKIGFSVDFCMPSIEAAIKSQCQMLICHHGMIWKAPLPIAGATKTRIKTMFSADISLYAAHLPLDIHPEIGNNKIIASLIPDFTIEGGFHIYKGHAIGVKGRLKTAATILDIKRIIDKALNTDSVMISPCKNKKIQTVGIISGSSASSISEAAEEKLDLFITGETSHAYYHQALECGSSMLCSGHYATETTGIKALMNYLKKKYDIETEFFDLPTGL